MARIDGMRDRTIVNQRACPRPTASPAGASAGARSSRNHPGHPQSPRLPNRWRRRSVAASMRARTEIAASLTTTNSPPLTPPSASALLKILNASGFTVYKPRGAYDIMTDISRFHFDEAKYPADSRDVSFAKISRRKIGVACVPGSSFYKQRPGRASQFRFTFCKKEETLAAAEARLAKLHA